MRPVPEACLSWIFLYCLAGQVPAQRCEAQVQRSRRCCPFCCPLQGCQRAAAPTARGECGSACMSWVLLWREARLSPIHQTHVYLGLGGRAGSELSVLPLTVCSYLHPLLCRHQALAHGHKLPELQRSGLARLAHIQTTPTRMHAAAANCACTFREGKGAPVPRLESGSPLCLALCHGSQTRSLPHAPCTLAFCSVQPSYVSVHAACTVHRVMDPVPPLLCLQQKVLIGSHASSVLRVMGSHCSVQRRACLLGG